MEQNQHEKEVWQEFERRRKAILEELNAEPKDFEVILERHQKEIESLPGEKRKLELKLQVEQEVYEDGYEQRHLSSRIKGVDVRIRYEEETLGSPKGLLEAISESTGIGHA